MFEQLPLIPDQASTLAESVDYLFYYISIVTASVCLLVYGVMLYFCARYHRGLVGGSTPRILGSHRLELAWTITPVLVFLSFFAWGAIVFNEAVRQPPDAPEIYVVGKQWMWKIQHPNGQREVNELHVPVGRPFRLTMTSEDVIHSFGIPAFRSKVDVVPGRYTHAWFTPTKVGEFHLFCDQLCGIGHSQMIGKVHVMRQEDYDKWLNGLPDGPHQEVVDGSLAWEGRKLFLKLQCVTCHSANTQAKAPILEGLYGSRVPLKGGGSVTADDNYIKESIRKPRAKVVEGWEAIMPEYDAKHVSEEDIIKLIAYIKSLRRDMTPKRTDEFPAPVGAPTGAPTSTSTRPAPTKTSAGMP